MLNIPTKNNLNIVKSKGVSARKTIVFASSVVLEDDVCWGKISQETLVEANSITYNRYHVLVPGIKGIVLTLVKTSWEKKRKKSYISIMLKPESKIQIIF